jgi:hypothetical protein
VAVPERLDADENVARLRRLSHPAEIIGLCCAPLMAVFGKLRAERSVQCTIGGGSGTGTLDRRSPST